ncbi:gliding motility-associated C-terminal domain-containing protein [Geojedonia litorea]|uniref:Gliding motility-associated C-terminal domain-containing protein n=1 Tax=Geojedonia litorea TaxID=1268269 RepID=A0ABV9N3G4_9FLAO
MGSIVSYTVQLTMCIGLLLLSSTMLGQSLKQPELQFSAPCVSASFNEFHVNFAWDPPMVYSDNKFILELSDKDGSFANPRELVAYGDKNTIFKFEFVFAFPTDLRGTNYKVRVRSTNPQKISPESNAFPAYYLAVNQPLVINNFVGTIASCDGSPVTINVTNYPNQPAYRWYRNGTYLSSQNQSSITTSQAGIYYVELDYGTYCSSATLSNAVELVNGQSTGVSINGSNSIEVCEGQSHFLVASLDNTNTSYKWFRNNQAVSTSGYHPRFDINTVDNAEGTWHVEIQRNGGCMERSGNVTVQYKSINASLQSQSGTLLLPGDEITLEASTNATQPSYSWYRNDVLISNATEKTYATSQPGSYFAKIKESAGCILEIATARINIEIPTSISVSIGKRSDYLSCESASTEISLSTITATLSDGSEIDAYNSLVNRFSYQWYRNTVLLANATTTSLMLDGPEDNGIYKIKAALNDLNLVSNEEDIKLGLSNDLTITSVGSLSCDGSTSVKLSANVTDPNFTYQWYKDGQVMDSENSPYVETNESGTFKLEVNGFGCSLISENLTISPLNTDVVQVDSGDFVTINEGISRTINATGADSYAWYRAETLDLISNDSYLTISEEGQYILKASVNGCEITKTITVEYLESFAIPNVITPNADGYNDKWILPNSYANNSNVEVSIFTLTGERVIQTYNYQNDWPQNNIPVASSSKKPIYFYKITKDNNVLRKGTITVID